MEKKVVSIEDLEQQVRLLKERIQENREVIDLSRLEEETKKLQRKIFSDLESWQRVQLARHTGRPYFFDYVERIVTDFYELHGARAYGDDKAMVGGIGLGAISEAPRPWAGLLRTAPTDLMVPWPSGGTGCICGSHHC